MNHDIKASDPLAWAIGEFREELVLWIDTELVRLRERGQPDHSVMEEDKATESGSEFSASSSRPGMSNGSPDFRAGMARQEPQARARVDARDSVVETTIAPVALPEPQTDPELRPPASNPRQRLDALARLLDHRLKQAQGAAETSSGAG